MFLATVNHMVDCATGVGGKPGSRTDGSTSVEMPTTEDGTGIYGMGSGEIMLNNGPEIFVTSETLVQGGTFFFLSLQEKLLRDQRKRPESLSQNLPNWD
ncbi:hypothetical protein J6895_04264 [Nakaseomyces glabratus]|nr:hypothetical protein J6895_04264 [Nakaseomyces glabratus]